MFGFVYIALRWSADIHFSIDILLRWSKETIYCPNQDLQDGQDGQDKRLFEPGWTGFTGILTPEA